MKKTKLKLTGYFDNNFGDDYMMKMIVRSLPELEFIIDKRESNKDILLSEKNVSTKTNPEGYPILNIIGSGFMINSKRALLIEIIWFFKKKKSGDYCLGCNIEPLGNGLKKFLICAKLNKYKTIVCRDKVSYEWLTTNLSGPDIKLLPDILFGMSEDFLPKRVAPDKLGIACLHKKGDGEFSEYYKKMAEIADFWIESTGKNVLLMAFDSGCENDLYACDGIKKLMRNQKNVRIVVHKKGDEILTAYSECEKIIGARFHSVVLGMKMNIPVYPLIFRSKTKNLISDTDYPVKGCNIDRIDTEKIKQFLIDTPKECKIDNSYIESSYKYAKVLREALDKE